MKGHFERGAWIPPHCNQCGLCCEYFWFKPGRDEDYIKFELLHGGVKRVGDVMWMYAPCRHLETHWTPEGRVYKVCRVHGTDEQPDCCKDYGPGDYYHPPGCAFEGEK
jgi:hypothetical protein